MKSQEVIRDRPVDLYTSIFANVDDNKGGKYDKSPEDTRWHSRKRRELGIMGKGGKDVTKKGLESLKVNRGRGGAQRK